MTGLLAVLLSLGTALVVAVVGDLVSDEARGRLERLPYSLIRLVARRLPERDRTEYTEEWCAELAHRLASAGQLPITRLVKGLIFAAGLIRATYHLAGRERTRFTTEDGDVVTLVRSAQNGSAEAFGRLYDRYNLLVQRYVFYRVGSQQLAEDVTSETFLRAFRRLNTFNSQGRDFDAWLVTIARNIVADHFKSSGYRLEATTAEILGSDSAEESSQHNVLKSFTDVVLIEAIKQLGPEQQECLVLRFLQGLSLDETARIMGRDAGAVKALQHRALRALGRLLTVDGTS